jgi:hypothetical protein
MNATKRVGAVLAAVGAAVAIGGGAASAATKPPPPPAPTYSYSQCQTTPGGAGQLCVTVDPAGVVNPNTTATVSGTVTCTPGFTWYGNVRVWQDAVGPAPKTDQIPVGSAQSPVTCTGSPQPYTVTTRTVGYHPGSARVITLVSMTGPAGLATVQVDTGDYQTVPATPGVTLI